MKNGGITTRSVVLERELPHPPEKVWRALTQPQLIAGLLAKTDFNAEVGFRFSVRIDPPAALFCNGARMGWPLIAPFEQVLARTAAL